jgi:hypothetical protein
MTVSHYVSILAWSSTFGAYWFMVTQQRHDGGAVSLVVLSFLIALISSSVYWTGRK